jgi:AraC family transcriptional regulator, ethanolamine operon transcriptional activator
MPFDYGVRQSALFDEFDAMAAAATSWDVDYAQVGRGRFFGRMDLASTPRIQFLHEHWNLGILSVGSTPAHAMTFGLPISMPGGVYHCGVPLPLGQIGVHQAGAELHFLSTCPLELLSMVVDEELLAEHLRIRFRLEPESLAAPGRLPVRGPPDAVGRALALITLLSRLPQRGWAWQAQRQLEERALEILLRGIASPVPQDSLNRERIARQAEDFARAHLDDPPSIRDLCAATECTERSLHHAFLESFGMPPARYLRILRLNAARRAMLSGHAASVTAAATDFGFFHFGRFARDYRGLFGETPSETMRHVRGVAMAA